MPAVGAIPPAPPIWHAAPPEVHSTLLTTGATPAGITAAGASWTQLAGQYVAGIAELEGILAQVQATYQGPSAEKFVATHMPMLVWMADVAAKATAASAAHAEITAAYETAVATMPTMPELINNHVVHAGLVSTNFFGVNTIPIGLNEADYVRMWNQAADTMVGYDGATTMSVDSIVDTPPSPITLLPGVGEAGNAAATSAGSMTQAQASAGGTAMTGAQLMGSKLLAGKAASSWASVADKTPGPQTSQAQAGADQNEDLAQQALQPENMAGSFMQQASSIASSAPQAASSAAQGPSQLLTQAPQTLASAPQQLGSMLTQFSGGFGGSELAQQSAMPVGFAGTGAIKSFNPAGMTSMAGGALGTGPSKPLMPSTWGATPTSAADSLANSTRAMSPAAVGVAGTGASGSGAGGAAMMGRGAAAANRNNSQQVTTYADDAIDDESDADSDGRAFAMTR